MLNEPVLMLLVILDPLISRLSFIIFIGFSGWFWTGQFGRVSAGFQRVSSGPQQQVQSVVRMRTDGDKSVL